MVLVIVFFYLLFQSHIYADDSLLGQKDFKHYYGPTYPLQKINYYNLNTTFEDSFYEKNYIETKVQTELFNLNDYFIGELYQGMNCPDIEYSKLSNDIHFYIRLVSLSYLQQALSETNYNLKRIGSSSQCLESTELLLGKCRPSSAMMKNLLKNSKKLLNDEMSYVPFDEGKKSSVENWILSISNEFSPTLTLKRLKDRCHLSHCRDKNNVEKEILNICREQREMFLGVCSEKDKNYGLSHITELYHSLTAEPTYLSMHNKYLGGCLRRFIDSNTFKEKKYDFLKDIFTYKMDENIKRGTLRGKLFKIGELNEIHKRGLKDIFPERKKTKNIVDKKNVAKAHAPQFKPIVLPKFKKEKIKRAKPIKVLKKKTVKTSKPKSAFYIASKFRRKFSGNKVKVDMKRFKYDYLFDLKFIQIFKPTVYKFSTIKSLNDMKKYDDLGSSKSPIPLKFLKFLIENKDHKKLYNIIQVVGSKFYVENDIDFKNSNKGIEKIFIDNSQATNHNWQIFIIQPD